jgi:hypothetical protein
MEFNDWSNGGLPLNRREWRKKEAAERQAERENRTDTEQLAKLVRAGHGHCKEAKRLRGDAS